MAWSARVSASAQSVEQTMRGVVDDWMQLLHNARPQYAQMAMASVSCLEHFIVCYTFSAPKSCSGAAHISRESR